MKNICLLLSLLSLIACSSYADVTGNVTFVKRTNSDLTQSGIQEDITTALYGVKVSLFNDGGSTELETTTTGSDGSFSFTTQPTGSYTVVVYSQNDHIEVGTSVSSGSNPVTSGIYTKSSTGLAGDGPHSINITIDENSGAFNIINTMEQGIRFIENLNYSIPSVIKITWPDSFGSYFEPDNFTMGLLGISSDPDEWDDDIILHEFGHAVAEAISIDHSRGGSHSLSGRHDMRLTWSEGLATYILSAIKGDPNYRDTNGSTNGNGTSSFSINYSIANPSVLAMETTNEVAVSYVLYQAEQATSAATVFATIASFADAANSSKLDSEQATMDVFHDLWTGPDLTSDYSNRGMLYSVDTQLNNNVSGNAIELSEGTLTNLTFYPDGNSDFFKHIGSIDDVLTIETNNSKNGALTGIKLYRLNGTSLIEVASNNQENGLTSDTTSKLVHTLDTTATYIIEILRFNSSTTNYGLGSGDGYSKTAGIYGSYDLAFSYVRTVPLSTSVYDLTSSAEDSTVNTSLSSLLTAYNSTDLTSQFKAFGNVITSGAQRNFTNTNSSSEVTNISVINSTGANTVYSVSDDELPLTVSGIPSGITAVIGLLPISFDSTVHDFSREKLLTVDLLDGSDIYTSSFELDFAFTSANLSDRAHQTLKQNSTTFTVNDVVMNIVSDNLLTSVTSAGVYSLRKLVNANSTEADRVTQLTSFINNNSIGDLNDELIYFHHLVEDNGDQATVGYNSTTNVMVVKSASNSTSYASNFNVDGNVTVSGIQADSVMVFTSLPKSLSSSVPENAEDQIYFFNNIIGDSLITSFTFDVDLLDQGRSDFDYYLHDYQTSSFDLDSEITTTTPNLSFNITSPDAYIISANVDSANATTSTLTYLVDDLLDNTTSVVELSSSSNNFAQLISIGNVTTTTSNTTITLNTVSAANTTVSHSDTETTIEIESIPQGNAILIMTIPSSEEATLPTGAVGELISLNLYDSNNTEITTGFSLPITLNGLGDDTKDQDLYFQNSDGTWTDSGFSKTVSGSNITFTATHFTVFTLVESDTASAGSSSGGGGGGCLLR